VDRRTRGASAGARSRAWFRSLCTLGITVVTDPDVVADADPLARHLAQELDDLVGPPG
jgi:hypothetical protein